jgi:hypothetical protein
MSREEVIWTRLGILIIYSMISRVSDKFRWQFWCSHGGDDSSCILLYCDAV